jgi:NADH-quinone oxidoreductase subunit M
VSDELIIHAAQGTLLALQWAPRALALAAGRGWLPEVAAAGPSSAAATLAPAATAAPAASPVVTAPPTAAPTTPGTSPTTTATGEFPTILLSSLIWAALLAAAVILFLPERTKEQRDRIRIVGLAGAGVSLFLAAVGVNYQIAQDLLGGEVSFEEVHSWITSLPVHVDYHVAADGVSLPLLLLSTLVFAAALVASWRVERRTKLYVVLLLLLETGVNGSLCAFDYVLLLLFLGLEIVPLFLLIAIWGGEDRMRAAWRWLCMATLSWALLLAAILLIGFKGGQGNFTFLQINGAGGSGVVLTGGIATAAFWLCFAACAIRLPIVPVHTWFRDAVSASSPPVAAIIAGISTTMGGYLLLRVVLPGFPAAAHRFSLPLAVLAGVTALWGAVAALAQDDVRRLLAYAGLSQMSLVLLAVSAQSSIALNGAVLQLVAHGLSSAMLLLLAGGLEERARTRSITRLGGLAWQMPRFTLFWMIAGLSAVGVPFLAGFAAEFQVFLGSYPAHRVATVVVMAATLVSTGAVLWMLQRVFFGPAREAFARVRDAGTLEMLYLIPMVVALIAFGMFVGRVMPMINNGVQLITARLSGG